VPGSEFLNNPFAGITFSTSLLGSKFSGTLSPVWDMPALHNGSAHAAVAPASAKPEVARFAINWLSAAGTGVFVAALLSGLILKLNAAQ
jgi:lactate permease